MKRVVIDGRERYERSEQAKAYLQAARADLEAAQHAVGEDELSRADLGRALQRLSEVLRLSGELDESRALKQRALEIWIALERTRAQFLVRVQLALVDAELGADPDFDSLREDLDRDARLQSYRDLLDEYQSRARTLRRSRER